MNPPGTPGTPGNPRRGLLAVISGPSGVGKTTIAHAVERELGGVFSVSLTTRPRAAADRDGVDYHFVDHAEFLRHRDEGNLLEWAQIYDHFYGTPRRPVLDAMAAGRLMILEIDVQGAVQVKRHLPDAFAVFILPPDGDELLARLRNRRREDESVIQRRFAKAKAEIAAARASGIYDAFVVNDELAPAIRETIDLVARRMGQGAA